MAKLGLQQILGPYLQNWCHIYMCCDINFEGMGLKFVAIW